MQCKRIIHLNNGTAILNEDIYLGMKDKEVEVLFELEGFSFNDGNLYGMTGAKIIVKKPNGERYNSSFVSLRNDMIVWNVNQELIDELVEVGNHDIQIVLTDGTSEITLPIIYQQVHVFNSLAVNNGNNSDINSSTVNQGHIATGDDVDIFTNTKGYNATTWVNNDTITDGKLNKIENALSYIMDNDVSFISPVNGILTLKEEKLQYAEIFSNTKIVLPAIEYVGDFILYLNCTTELKVSFQSSADVQEVSLVKGYHKVHLKFISDWLITL